MAQTAVRRRGMVQRVTQKGGPIFMTQRISSRRVDLISQGPYRIAKVVELCAEELGIIQISCGASCSELSSTKVLER